MNGFINLTQTNNKEINNLNIDLVYTENTGELEFILKHRENVIASKKVDLPLELLINSGYYNTETKELILILANNETIKIHVEDLIDEYYADNITLELTDVEGKQTFGVKTGSIGRDYLTADVWTNINFRESTSNRIYEINTQTATDTTYPSTRAVVNYVVNYVDSKEQKSIIETYELDLESWETNEFGVISQTIEITGKTADNHALVSNWQEQVMVETMDEVILNNSIIADANIYNIRDNGTSLTFFVENMPSQTFKALVEVFD